MAKCDSCGANVDLAKGSNMGHCATCNKVSSCHIFGPQ
jgi:hypothetical protein